MILHLQKKCIYFLVLDKIMRKVFKLLLWLFIIVVVVTAVGMTYKKVSSNLEPRKKETFSDQEVKPKKQLKITLFYATWCGHCEKYISSGLFDTTYKELESTGKYDNVVFVKVDSDKNRPMVNKYGIQGFPTIMAISSDGNLVDEFAGDRNDPEALKDFVNSSVKKL